MLHTGCMEPRLQAVRMEEVSPSARILHDYAVVNLAASTSRADSLDGVHLHCAAALNVRNDIFEC